MSQVPVFTSFNDIVAGGRDKIPAPSRVSLIMVDGGMNNPQDYKEREVEEDELTSIFTRLGQDRLSQDTLRIVMTLTRASIRKNIERWLRDGILAKTAGGLLVLTNLPGADGFNISDSIMDISRNTMISISMAFVLLLMAITLTTIYVVARFRRTIQVQVYADLPEGYSDYNYTRPIVEQSRYVTESHVPNSLVFDSVMENTPPCQLEIRGHDGVRGFGSALRFKQWLVTPHHVIISAIRSGEGFSVVKNSICQQILCKPDDPRLRILEGDLVAFNLGEATFSRLKASSARPARLEAKTMVSITSHFPTPRTSYGHVEASDVFGMVTYRGSTEKGFSGAAYTAGTAIYGMHTSGGLTNEGYSMSFIASCLKRFEGTSEYLEREFERDPKNVVFRSSPYNPREYQVKILSTGQYFTTDYDDIPDVYRDSLDDYQMDDLEGIEDGVLIEHVDTPPENSKGGAHCDPASHKILLEEMMNQQVAMRKAHQAETRMLQEQLQQMAKDYRESQASMSKQINELSRLCPKTVTTVVPAAEYSGAAGPASDKSIVLEGTDTIVDQSNQEKILGIISSQTTNSETLTKKRIKLLRHIVGLQENQKLLSDLCAITPESIGPHDQKLLSRLKKNYGKLYNI